jgi:hypothetical protein
MSTDDVRDEEPEATSASAGSAEQPEEPPPAEGDQPAISLPDPSAALDEIDDVVDEVTDALPIPDVVGD